MPSALYSGLLERTSPVVMGGLFQYQTQIYDGYRCRAEGRREGVGKDFAWPGHGNVSCLQ